MGSLTFVSLGHRTGPRIAGCVVSFASMMGVGIAYAHALYTMSLPRSLFLVLVAVNGICTGVCQSLGASLSGDFQGAPSAFLLGQSASLFVAVPIRMGVELVALPVASEACLAVTLVLCFLICAIGALLKVSMLESDSGVLGDTLGLSLCDCACERGGKPKEDVLRRLKGLIGNCIAAIVPCAIWLFLFSSIPYMAEGLCGTAVSCSSSLAPLMISAANVASVLGRTIGLPMRGASLGSLIGESMILSIVGFLAISSCVSGWPVSFRVTEPTVVGLVVVGMLSCWCNLALMRNDHNGQKSCGDSIIAPRPVTTQVMWLAMQVGSIAGTLCASFWWAHIVSYTE